MRILLICNKSPWPAAEGGPIAINAMVEGLIEAGHSVKVLAINSNKYFINPESIPEAYRKKTEIELVYTDLRIKWAEAFINLFSPKSYHVSRFITKELATAIERILKKEEFDIIQFETLFVTPYLKLVRQLSKAPVFLRAHNIEFLIWERLFNRERNFLKKLYLGHLYRSLKRYELDVITKLDGIIAITPTDKSFFANLIPEERIVSIPFGVTNEQIENAGRFPLSEPNNCIFHLGSMNWLPNTEGIEWFLKEVWPELKENKPEIVFHLAGRGMPDWLMKIKDPQIIIDGEVLDSVEYMRKYRLMIVPLFSGSGIRIKIIEGMMAGCAIVTTPIGAEGIEYTDGVNIIIANGKNQFLASVKRLLSNKSLIMNMGKEASTFIAEKHNNSLLIKELESFYNRFSE